MVDNEKILEFLVEFSGVKDKSRYLEFWKKLLLYPKKIVSFIPNWYIFEYFGKFLEWKIRLEDLVYLGDVYSKKKIYKNQIVFESLFTIKMLLQIWKKRFKNSYILIAEEAKKYYEIKFDFEWLKKDLEKINSELIVI